MIPAFHPAPSASVPPANLAPPGIADMFDTFRAAHDRYLAAVGTSSWLDDPTRDDEARTADTAARLDAARAGDPVTSATPAADDLRRRRADAAAEMQVASTLLIEAYDHAAEQAAGHVDAGQAIARDRIAGTRAALEASLAAVAEAHAAWRRSLGLWQFWQGLAEGKGLNYNDSGVGSFTVGHVSALPVDLPRLFQPIADEGTKVARLIDGATRVTA